MSSKRQMDTDADIDPDGNSIDTQRKVCQAREKALGLVNVGEYVEPGTSVQTVEKRTVFKQMLKRRVEQRDVALWGQGSSRAVVVGPVGFEPTL